MDLKIFENEETGIHRHVSDWRQDISAHSAKALKYCSEVGTWDSGIMRENIGEMKSRCQSVVQRSEDGLKSLVGGLNGAGVPIRG